MRGMIKWKPFNSLLKDSDILDIERKKMLESRPIIMEDRINSIDETIREAISNKLDVSVLFFSHGMLKRFNGKILEVNVYEKYILISKTRIYFKNLIDLQVL